MSDDVFKGVAVSELMQLWQELQSPEGIALGVPKEKLKLLDEYLEQKQYKDSVFATKYSLKRPLVLKKNKQTLKAGVVLLNLKNHKIGLIYREKQNDYTFPKGHLEKGETLQECAIRETAEETKRDCVLLCEDPIGIISYQTPEGEECKTYMYLAQDTGHSDNTSLEVHDLKWVNWDSVEKKLTYDNLKTFWNNIKDSVKEQI